MCGRSGQFAFRQAHSATAARTSPAGLRPSGQATTSPLAPHGECERLFFCGSHELCALCVNGGLEARGRCMSYGVVTAIRCLPQMQRRKAEAIRFATGVAGPLESSTCAEYDARPGPACLACQPGCCAAVWAGWVTRTKNGLTVWHPASSSRSSRSQSNDTTVTVFPPHSTPRSTPS